MTPSFDTRLQAIIGALEHMVMPALAGADSLVQEQAGLALAHLKIIRDQLPHGDDYHLICLKEMIETGEALASEAAGDAATTGAARALDAATQRARARFGDIFVVWEDRNAVAHAIDALIVASSVDGAAAFISSSQELLLEHGLRQSRRDRAWYGATGLDPDRDELGSIDALITSERTRQLTEGHAGICRPM